MLFYFLYIGYEAGFGVWIYTYALKLGLGTEITAAYLTSAFWAAFTFGRFLGIPTARRFSSGSHVIHWRDNQCHQPDINDGLSLHLRGVMDNDIALWAGSLDPIPNPVSLWQANPCH